MAWIEAIQSKWPFSGPPERRSDSQIDRDLDDEFAFHLEMKARELMTEGHELQAARDLAQVSFGDVQHIKARCKRIALEERIMLQRVNFVLMIVLALVVIGVGVQVFVTQRYNTLALQDITSQIAKMRLDAAAEAKDRGWAVPDTSTNIESASASSVLVIGEVERPGWYPIETKRGATYLSDVVSQARPLEPAGQIFVGHTNERNELRIAAQVAIEDLQEKGARVVLLPQQEIRVRSATTLAATETDPPAKVQPKPGIWKQANAENSQMDDGAMLTIIGPQDIRNLSSAPEGHMQIAESRIRMVFQPADQRSLNLHIFYENGVAQGRWLIDESNTLVLNLNLAHAIPTIAEPLRFKFDETSAAPALPIEPSN